MKLIKIQYIEIDTLESDNNTQTFTNSHLSFYSKINFLNIIIRKLLKTFIKMIFSKNAAMI